MTDLSKLITPLHPDLRKELEAHAILKEVPQGAENDGKIRQEANTLEIFKCD